MHMFVFSWDPTLSFMQYLEHLKFLVYLIGAEHEGVGMRMTEDQFSCHLKLVSINGVGAQSSPSSGSLLNL